MEHHNNTPLAAPRVTPHDTLLIFGHRQRYERTNAGIPSQWERFVPYLGHIAHQVGHTSYGVIHNTDDQGNFDYLCGVEVTAYPAHPAEFTRIRIPPQTYAVFHHAGHVSSIAGTIKAIWNHGLTDAGLKASDAPVFERYGPEFDGRTGLGGLEIWVPIET